MSKEAMNLALEALKQIDEAMPFPVAKLAQKALREALAEPDFWKGYVPEPVGAVGSSIKSESPLGCNGPTGPAQQEPWGACVSGRVFVGRLPEHARKFSEDEGVPIQWLYTSPQPAQRKPLTDEQRERIAKGWRGRNWTVGDIIDATEAAHGIKENT
jgi:hypothetical protein